MLAPPKFKFRIVRSIQDPLIRQLSEAVRIELRGEEILNSKCRVPRLRGWIWKDGKKNRKKRKSKEGKNPKFQKAV